MDKCSSFVDDLAERLGLEGDGEKAVDAASHRLDVILQRCGWTSRSKRRLELLQRLLSAHGIVATPPVDTEGLERGERIRFTRTPPPISGMAFTKEVDLQRFLAENVERLAVFRGFKLVATEYLLPNDSRVDMLLENRAEQRWLAVELEKTQKDESPVQLYRYMVEIRDRKLPAGYRLDGMIISGRPHPAQIAAFRSMSYPGDGEVRWLEYRVQIDLVDLDGTVPLDDAEIETHA
jgi:hypothetical protein